MGVIGCGKHLRASATKLSPRKRGSRPTKPGAAPVASLDRLQYLPPPTDIGHRKLIRNNRPPTEVPNLIAVAIFVLRMQPSRPNVHTGHHVDALGKPRPSNTPFLNSFSACRGKIVKSHILVFLYPKRDHFRCPIDSSVRHAFLAISMTASGRIGGELLAGDGVCIAFEDRWRYRTLPNRGCHRCRQWLESVINRLIFSRNGDEGDSGGDIHLNGLYRTLGRTVQIRQW